jgi:hypothetical protein
MTEAEWLACDNPQPMFAFLGKRASNRKLRLFACACCRTLWDQIEDEDVRKALAASERFADGLIRDSTLTSWHRRAVHARDHVARSWADLVRQGRTSEFGRPALYYAVAEVTLTDQHRGQVAGAWHPVAGSVAVVVTGGKFVAGQHELEAARAEAARAFPPLLRDVIGNPFRPVTISPGWLTPDVTTLAQAAYDERLPSGTLDLDRLAVLSDALEDAGCDSVDLLGHLRSPGPHVRGCWVVDLLLGKK